MPGNPLIETARSTFAGSAAYVGQARRFIAEVLGGQWPRLDDIVLLASEVASNAVRFWFAVATLRDWYRDGGDVQARLPLLSAYLGHVSPESTYWYLQAVPELLSLAAERLEHHAGEAR